MNALSKAIELAGGLGPVASALGVAPQTLANWRARGVPLERCADVESVVGVSRRDLRPADWHKIWPELAAVRTEDAA